MFDFSFLKKKEGIAASNSDQLNRKLTLDEIEAEETVLDKETMGLINGAQTTVRPITEFPDLRDILGGTIPS